MIWRPLYSWLGAFVVLIVALSVLQSILLPFVAGMAIAYFLDPVADKLEQRKVGRTLATLIVLGTFFILVIAAVLMLAPVLQSQIAGFADRLPNYIERLRDTALPLLMELAGSLGLGLELNAQEAFAGVANDVVAFAGRLLGKALSSGIALFNLATLLLISPIVAFYLLRDWDRMTAKIDAWLPRAHATELRGLLTQIDEVLGGFVRGQGSVCIILGIFYATALSVTGLEFGLVIGLFSGLVSFIPFVGAAVGLILSMLTAITQFWPDYIQIGMIAFVFVVGQILEGNFLTPKLLGEKVGLHPVWVIFALLAGGTLFGFVGVLLALPGAAIFGVLVRFSLSRYLTSALYLGAGSDGGAVPLASGDREALAADNNDAAKQGSAADE